MKFTDLIKAKTLPTPVDCGNCPVSMACAVSEGGTGFVFNCCRSFGFEVIENDEALIYVVDCQKHRFPQKTLAAECKVCPLCTGEIMEVALRDIGNTNRYVPTVHAKVPVAERVRLFREAAKTAKENIENDRKRR